MKSKLQILTLNCWGIPGCIPTLSSPHRKQRISAIGQFLRGAQYDLVFLQEVWTHSDYDHIVEQVQLMLPYSFYYKTGVIGSGTCIFSKYRLEHVASITFTLNGYTHQVWLGDGLAGSGVGVARLRIDGMEVVAAVSHFHAEYNRDNDAFLTDRCCQALEVLNILKLFAPWDLILLCGDLNTEPGDLPHRVLTQYLTDAWHGVHQKTWGNQRNSYTPSEFSPGTQAATLDYILYRGGPGVNVGVELIKLATESRIPGGQVSYSDHEAVQAALTVEKEESQLKGERDDFEHDLKQEKENSQLKGEKDDLKQEKENSQLKGERDDLKQEKENSQLKGERDDFEDDLKQEKENSQLKGEKDDLKQELVELLEEERVACRRWQWLYGCGAIVSVIAASWMSAAPWVGPWIVFAAGAAATFCVWMGALVLQRRRIALTNIEAQVQFLKRN